MMMKKIFTLFLFLMLSIFVCSVYAKEKSQVIKLAILDNFHYQKYITNKFPQEYIKGLQLADRELAKKGYKIKYQVFRYGDNDPLAIFDAINQVKQWHPDVIFGPRNSNSFLLLGGQFKKVLVLSPFATSNRVSAMPKNYYSLMMPDKYMAEAMYHYVRLKYPDKKVFGIIEADCKNCMDVASGFAKIYNKNHPKKKIKMAYYVKSNIKHVDIKDLMSGYQQGSIILLPNTAYTSTILMLKITNFLNRSVLFLGGDDWGAWKNTEVGKLHANKPYYAIHFTPASLDLVNDPLIRQFKRQYKQVYKVAPVGDAALIAYRSAYAFVDALGKYGHRFNHLNMRKKILKSFELAVEKNPNWYKEKRYAVYFISETGEVYTGSFSAIDGKKDNEKK